MDEDMNDADSENVESEDTDKVDSNTESKDINILTEPPQSISTTGKQPTEQ